MSTNINKLITSMKFNAYRLERVGCLPLFLFKDICRLDLNTDVNIINEYKYLTSKYLRIKGFYNTYKDDFESLYCDYIKDKKERGLV